MKSKFWRNLGIFFLVMIALRVLFYFTEGPQPTTATETKQAPPIALTPQQLDSLHQALVKGRQDSTVKAPNLVATYEANEITADETFKDKTFYVEGVVTDIKKDMLNNMYVILKGGQGFRDVQCFFDDKDIATQLQKGMNITFKGKCDGLMVNVIMKQCVWVENLSTIKKRK
jgi:hypothetical protein